MNTLRFPGRAGYTKSRCRAGAPRLPTSGSELSLLILVSMLPSSTAENSPVAYTQFLTWRHGDTAFIQCNRSGILKTPTIVRYRRGETFRG